MSAQKKTAAFAATVLFAALAGWFLGAGGLLPGVLPPPHDEAAMSGGEAAGERRILYYRNPMGLADTSLVPKQDSMGMDYIPVYEGEESEDGTVTVSAGKLQRTGVRTVAAVIAPLSVSIRAPGIVTLDERQVSVIALRTDGFIESVADVTTGARIEAGAPLFSFYSPEIAKAIALFVSDSRGGAAQARGARQRLENLGVPPEVISRLAANGTAEVTIPLSAPRSGVVLERMASEGMMAKAGETLFRIADLSAVWIVAELPEAQLAQVREGALARISFPGLTGLPIEGQVSIIHPEIDLVTRTGRLRIELPNKDGLFRVNMFVDAEIRLSAESVLQVPDSAVISTGDRQVVIRDLGEGRFKPQPVRTGRRGGGMVEIAEGLDEGDRVVSAATFLIDAESNLNAALKALDSAGVQP